MGLPGREAAGAKNQRWEEKLAKAEALPSRRDGRGGGGVRYGWGYSES